MVKHELHRELLGAPGNDAEGRAELGCGQEGGQDREGRTDRVRAGSCARVAKEMPTGERYMPCTSYCACFFTSLLKCPSVKMCWEVLRTQLALNSF